MSLHKIALPTLILLAAALALATVVRPASSAPRASLPAPVPPEPYPFSDRYPAVVLLQQPGDMDVLLRLGILIDSVTTADDTPPYPLPGSAFEPLLAEVFIDKQEALHLAQAGLDSVPIPNEGLRAYRLYGPGSGVPDAWPTFEQFVARMQSLQDNYPNLVQLISIGKSVQNRDLWCLKLSDNVTLEEAEPEFKYTSSMHGDETVGIEITLRLAELLLQGYGSDPDLTALVDGIETWLCPIHNPDGYVNGTRWNAHGQNLNRDFPDRITDPIDDPAGREPETQAFMYFGYDHRFSMGANYHGGAQVVNYPWDAVESPPDYAPDDQLFFDYSVGYSSRNPMIWNGGFPNGVTRGWEWYYIYGGMQDWAYLWRNEFHVTIEVSNNKMPPYEQMDTYWANNQAAMLWWMERALTGLGGRVLDARDSAPLDAVVRVLEYIDQPNTVRTDPQVGDYHRVIGEGSYTLQASASGYLTQTAAVSVISGTLTLHDFALQPIPLPDLTPSLKRSSSDQAVPGDSLDYTLVVANEGYTTTVALTDSLPAGLSWNGWLTATAGSPTFADGQILWQGESFPGEAVTVTYGVTVENCLPAGTDLLNLALFAGDRGSPITRTQVVSISNAVPGAPDAPGPADGAVNQPLQPALTWSASPDTNCDAITYNLAFGTENPPPLVAEGLTTTLFIPGELSAHTTYYWQVTANDGISQAISDSWAFTTLNHAPDSPLAIKPSDGAAALPLTQVLSWQGADPDGDSLTYALAFGASTPPPLIANSLIASSYNPGLLLPGITYYWQVTASDGLAQTSGPVWSFTTRAGGAFLPLVLSSP